jgi:hypothetical protein
MSALTPTPKVIRRGIAKPARGLAHAAARIGRGWMAERISGAQRAAHVVSLCARFVALFEVRFAPLSGLKPDIAPCRKSAPIAVIRACPPLGPFGGI